MHKQFQKIEESLNDIFVEREKEIHGLTLAILSNNNLLYLGPPGTGKSMLARKWSEHIKEAEFFSWLLSPMTKDTEVLGAPNINQLIEEGKEVRNTNNKLPEAHVAFLDEIWKVSSALANHLLKIFNERKFDNGEGDQDIPLLTVVTAANQMPDEESNLEAAVDRFVLKYDVEPVQEAANVVDMMGSHLDRIRGDKTEEDFPKMSLTQIEEAKDEIKKVTIPENIKTTIYKIQNELYDEQIYPSARTINNCLQILQAEAFYHGRDEVIEDDLAILVNCFWNDPSEYKKVFTIVMENISPEEPKILEIFEDSKEIYEDLRASEASSDMKTEDALEVVNKLQEAKQKMLKHKKSLKDKGKNTKEAERMVSKVNEYLENVFLDILGVDPDDN